jgi:T4 RnlA family RNA ligase
MSHYPFPKIEHIDQIKEAIAGRDEFIIAERDGFSVVNYMVHLLDSFPPIEIAYSDGQETPGFLTTGPYYNTQADRNYAIRRECRGLVFGPHGEVISRRYHKFFNVNERPETMMNHIDLSKPHVILEKLDGSMITPIKINGEIRWCTKMGITDMTPMVEEFVEKKENYKDFAKHVLLNDNTPIFEWCSRKNRIVIDHPEDRLILTAIRHNLSGKYYDYADLIYWAKAFNIDVVQNVSFKSLEGMLAATKELKDVEGWVVRFDDGQMIKIKCDWYCRLHATKDMLTREKDIVELIVNSQMDDQKPFMLAEDVKKVEHYEIEFFNYLIQYGLAIKRIYMRIRDCDISRKDFALGMHPFILKDLEKSLIFRLWDDPTQNIYEMLSDVVKKNVSTGRKFEAIKKQLFPDLVWDYYQEIDGE